MANNEKAIWEYLQKQLGNNYGAAGLMGNLYAESALEPKNLQNSYENSLGYTDDSYTEAVDSGKYTNFVKDSAGYGLAQWTYWSRKQNMYNFMKGKGLSIGDLNGQLDFLMEELSSDYSSVLKTLKNATSVSEASNAVLLNFEKPADQSASVQSKRTSYGQNYYDKYVSTTTTETTNSSTSSSVNTDFPDVPFTFKSLIDDLVIRSGPKKTYDQVGTAAKGTYTVIEMSGKWGKLKSGQGWVYLGYPARTEIGSTVAETKNTNYLVKVTVGALNIRSGPSTSYSAVGMITDRGTYTIVEESNNWGKLKSGAGWICLDYTQRKN